MFNMSWLVAHLRPRTEKKFAQVCELAGITHYLPLRRETKVYQRRRVTVNKPVFPGYVFVDCPEAVRLIVLQSPYTVRLLVPEDEATLLHQIEQVRRALAVDPELETDVFLKSGRRVRIIGGPFMGIEGTVAHLRGRTEVKLNVEMVGQAVTVIVAREYLAVADD